MDSIEDHQGLLVGTFFTLDSLLRSTTLSKPLRIKYYRKRRAVLLWGEHSNKTYTIGHRKIRLYKSEWYHPSGRCRTSIIPTEEEEQIQLGFSFTMGKNHEKYFDRDLDRLRFLAHLKALPPNQFYATYKLFFNVSHRVSQSAFYDDWGCETGLDALIQMQTIGQECVSTNNFTRGNFEEDYITNMTRGYGLRVMYAMYQATFKAYELKAQVGLNRE